MRYIALILVLSTFFGCNKPNPEPEKSDEIYKDLLQELDIASKSLESEIKNLAKLEAEKDKVIPQTGQIRFAQKKIFETEETINKLKQQKQFFEIKIELRKNEVRNRYIESRRGGRKWPDKAEIANYKAVIKFEHDKLEWERNRGMKKNVPRGTSNKNKSRQKEEGAEAPEH